MKVHIIKYKTAHVSYTQSQVKIYPNKVTSKDEELLVPQYALWTSQIYPNKVIISHTL